MIAGVACLVADCRYYDGGIVDLKSLGVIYRLLLDDLLLFMLYLIIVLFVVIIIHMAL